MSLCEELTIGEETSSTLVEHEEDASNLEIHAEKGVQKLTFPEHDDEDHDDDMVDEQSILMEIFNESDTNGDSLLDINELEGFNAALDALEEDDEDGHEGHDHGDDHSDHGDGDEHDHGDDHSDDGDHHDDGDGHNDGDGHQMITPMRWRRT